MNYRLDEIIEDKPINEMLSTISNCVDLVVQLTDENGIILAKYGEWPQFCQLSKEFFCDIYVCCSSISDTSCCRALVEAGKKAMNCDDQYIFSCPANLVSIARPIQKNGELLGTVYIGPFLLDKPDHTLLTRAYSFNEKLIDKYFELYDSLFLLHIIDPSNVLDIAKLIHYLLIELIPDDKLRATRDFKRSQQQSFIGEFIQSNKNVIDSYASIYPYEKENDIIVSARNYNFADAERILNELFAILLSTSGGNIDNIRHKAIEITVLISRVAIDNGSPIEHAFSILDKFLYSISLVFSFDKICALCMECIHELINSMYNITDVHKRNIITEAIRYISQHYSETITIEVISTRLGLSPSYFSRIFKETVGKSFIDYLNTVRIAESKRLLKRSDLSIIDVAMLSGFSDQSYFTKVFKKYTGMSPGQFR